MPMSQRNDPKGLFIYNISDIKEIRSLWGGRWEPLLDARVPHGAGDWVSASLWERESDGGGLAHFLWTRPPEAASWVGLYGIMGYKSRKTRVYCAMLRQRL